MPTSWEVLKTYPPCAFEGCRNRLRIKASGLCQPHNNQRLRGEELHPLRRPNGEPWPTDSGYLRVTAGGRQRMAHCVVMEAVLGRPLTPDETVHHKNGVRHDNRRTNLELKVGAHGPGMSVEEAVSWATEILARYC